MSARKRQKLDDGSAKDKDATERLNWLLGGEQKVQTFWDEYWGKRCMVLNRKRPDYYKSVFKDFNINGVAKIVDEKKLEWGVHLTGRKTVNGVRFNTSPDSGFATGAQVMELYNSGSTIQFHQPQQHVEELAEVVEDLEHCFGALVGVNTYLTPPQAQGLAPHSDDICAFALQTHGRKTWNLHELAENDRLPIKESKDLCEDDLPPKSMEASLEVGDLLYFPKGCIHYATTSDEPSVHLTVSTFQNWSWSALMEQIVNRSLEIATSKELAFRSPLPLNFLSYMGNAPAPSPTRKRKREQMISEVGSLFTKLQDHMHQATHECADEFGLEFTMNRLPPRRLLQQKSSPDLSENSCVRIVDPRFIRLAESWQYEDDEPEMSAGEDGEPGMGAAEDTDRKQQEEELQSATDMGAQVDFQPAELPEPHVPEPFKDELPAHFWLFDSLNNRREMHMMVSDVPLNPPLQLDEVFKPLVLELINTYPNTTRLSKLGEKFDIEAESVVELMTFLLSKKIIVVG